LKHYREGIDDAGGDHDLVGFDGLEAGETCGDAVGAEREILKEELAAAGADGGMGDAGVSLDGDDGGVGDGGASAVGDSAVDASAEGLRVTGEDAQDG